MKTARARPIVYAPCVAAWCPCFEVAVPKMNEGTDITDHGRVSHAPPGEAPPTHSNRPNRDLPTFVKFVTFVIVFHFCNKCRLFVISNGKN